MDNYISILEESLKQKAAILSDIQRSTQKQEELLKSEKFSMDAFDTCMDEKEQLIQKLEQLDDGFEAVYTRVKEQLEGKKDIYKDSIARMQELIREITDRSNAIQVKEKRNKTLLDAQLSVQRRSLNNGKRNTANIYNRYHNLNGAVAAQFMDQKQ